MIKVNQIKLHMDHSEDELRQKIAKTIRRDANSFSYTIAKKSIDSRKKPELFYVYSVYVETEKEAQIVKASKPNLISFANKETYQPPKSGEQLLNHRPVVIGCGPSGLFAAYLLTLQGYRPIILEQGKKVDERTQDVLSFWETGLLNPSSNVVFGEGGAGTFSDGKLNTSVKDASGRISFVLDTFHRFGAKESILYDQKPHIGTDELVKILQNMRNYMCELGCEFRFREKLIEYDIEQLNHINCFRLTIENQSDLSISHLDTEVLILCIGHGARDTFEMLNSKKLLMESKPFAVGFRVEHPQKMIDEFAYGSCVAERYHLPSAPYKVTSNFPNGRGVYSFCMCPGGYVVNSSSEERQLVVNGMSYSDRNSRNANSAIVVALKPEDFGNYSNPLSGLEYQRKLEEKAYQLANGKIPQQLYGDYRENRLSTGYGDFDSVTKGAVAFSNLRGLLGPEMEDTFIQGMKHFGHIVPGFDRFDAILSGIESRTSSPVRIIRDDFFESSVTHAVGMLNTVLHLVCYLFPGLPVDEP